MARPTTASVTIIIPIFWQWVGWKRLHAYSEAVFRHLVQRNAINWHANRYIGDVVLADQSDEDLRASAQNWLDDLQNGRSSPKVELPVNSDQSTALSADAGGVPAKIQRALLLVGSPKTRKSTSIQLAGTCSMG